MMHYILCVIVVGTLTKAGRREHRLNTTGGQDYVGDNDIRDLFTEVDADQIHDSDIRGQDDDEPQSLIAKKYVGAKAQAKARRSKGKAKAFAKSLVERRSGDQVGGAKVFEETLRKKGAPLRRRRGNR